MENNFIEMEWSRLWWLLSVVVTEYVLVLAAVGADMASGISKSRKRGEATRSRSLRRTVAPSTSWRATTTCLWCLPLSTPCR